MLKFKKMKMMVENMSEGSEEGMFVALEKMTLLVEKMTVFLPFCFAESEILLGTQPWQVKCEISHTWFT